MLTAPSALLLIQAIATGSIAGTLRDATTNDPLSGAQLVVVDLNQTAVTDADGRYRLDRLPAGRHRLLVRRIGYAPRTLDALVPADGAIEIMIVLRAEPIVLGAIDGAYPANESSPTDAHLDLAALRTHPLLAEPDAFQALSGGVVAVRPESPAGMHVRGGGSDQVTYLLDGFPVFSPYHSGEAFSAWNPDALAEADLVPASETWDALSGVVSAASRTPGRQHRAHAGFSTTHMRLTLDGPVGSRGAGYLWSLRSGFPGFPLPQHESTYLRSETGDQLGKLEAPLAGGRLRLLGYSTANELDTDGPAGGGPASRNTFNWQSTTIGGEWNKPVGAGFFRARVWIADGEANAAWHVDSSAELLASRRRDAGVSATLEQSDRGGHTAFGIRVQTSRMAYRVTPDAGSELHYASHAPLAALFLERAQRLDTRVGLTTAISATASTGAARVSPRVRLSWIPTSRLVLSGDVLRLYQFAQSLRNPESVAGAVFPVDLFAGASSAGVPIARSDEVIVAAAYRPAAGFRLSAQGYTRVFHDVVLVAPNSQDPFATAPLAIGSGIARGVSVDASHTTDRYTVFAVYGRQSVRFVYGANSYVPEYGATDAVDAGVMIHPSRALSLRLGASGRFGRRVTPLTTPFEWESCNVADRGCEFAGSPRTARDSLGATTLPGYVRVDLGIRNEWQLRIAGRTTDFGVFGTLTNVFARTNALTLAPDPLSGVRTPVTLRSRAPLVIGVDWAF
jgi:Carboxypeptidase regulatory-like domain